MKKHLPLAVAWVVGVLAVAVGGSLPDGYREHVLRLPEPQPYPMGGVAMFELIVTVEAVVLWALIRPRSYRKSWGRSLLAVAFLVPASLYFACG